MDYFFQYFVLFALVFLPMSGHADGETCDALLLKFVPSSPDDINARSVLVANALLDPSVPNSVVREFDFGVSPNPDQLQEMRASKTKTIFEDSTAHYPSFSHPQPKEPILLDSPMPRPDSRLSYFDGDFFSDSYFNRHQNTSQLDSPQAWKNFIQNQPWVQWVRGHYVVRLSGASARILNAIQGDSVTVYRGTVPQELALTQTLKHLAGESSTSSASAISSLTELSKVVNPASNLGKSLQELVAHPSAQTGARSAETLIRAYSADLQGRTNNEGALFVTTSLWKAKLFTKGTVISYRLPRKVLEDLLAKNLLYVGIEDQVEMAFIGPDAIQKLLPSMTESSVVLPNGNMWAEPAAGAGSIWR